MPTASRPAASGGRGTPACGSPSFAGGEIADTRPAGLCPSVRGGTLGVSSRCRPDPPRERRERRAAAVRARTVTTGLSSRCAPPAAIGGSPVAEWAKPTTSAAGTARIRQLRFIASRNHGVLRCNPCVRATFQATPKRTTPSVHRRVGEPSSPDASRRAMARKDTSAASVFLTPAFFLSQCSYPSVLIPEVFIPVFFTEPLISKGPADPSVHE